MQEVRERRRGEYNRVDYQLFSKGAYETLKELSLSIN